MSTRKHRRNAQSWLFVGALLALCGVLALLQYRWSGEISVAARDRLRGSLQATLQRLSRQLNSELAAESSGLLPASVPAEREAARRILAGQFAQWQKASRNAGLIRRLGAAIPQDQQLTFYTFDGGSLQESSWPAEWSGLEARIQGRLSQGRGPNGTPRDLPGISPTEDFTAETPLFPESAPGGPPRGFPRKESAWVIVEFNPAYLRDSVLPQITQQYLGTGGTLDYQVQIVSRSSAHDIIYKSDQRQSSILPTADASAVLFDPQQFLWQGPSGFGRGRGGGGPGGGGPDNGRWQIYVRHRAGSLEAVVELARWRNLAIAAGVVLLIVGTAGSLITFTRRTQRLAELQMDFVAGISHELRTPLTVIHTAAYNLQGKMAADHTQVERYGALIQRESARLTAMVEQILNFAALESGRPLQSREPVAIDSVIEEAVAAHKSLLDGAHCQVEKHIATDLPAVLGDRTALRQAIENLVTNAAKYGLNGNNWIGISAARTTPEGVEIRVADHGPGIPAEEREQIFDPFFRGARAREDQIRGTGLGLSLVKKILQAHGGDIQVESEPSTGTVFILRLPAAGAGS